MNLKDKEIIDECQSLNFEDKEMINEVLLILKMYKAMLMFRDSKHDFYSSYERARKIVDK
ncbi:MAG: hypothetical protein IPO21_16535 [Bacteroidales bacterium]|nr:hypothetical protein [Bacteroidales bacterium]